MLANFRPMAQRAFAKATANRKALEIEAAAAGLNLAEEPRQTPPRINRAWAKHAHKGRNGAQGQSPDRTMVITAADVAEGRVLPRSLPGATVLQVAPALADDGRAGPRSRWPTP